jgi:CO dehydrogenase nickel-insertion accessory protein CooC1
MSDGTNKTLVGKRIGIFGKGGSGKSTFAVLFARALRAAGYQVVVLDADSTNVGLCAALGIARRPRPLIDCFGGMVFCGGSVTCPVDDPSPLPDSELELGRIPAEVLGQTADGVKFLEAGKICA